MSKPAPVNHTVKHLLALPPGEAFVYYRGSLSEDIASSRGAPAYARLLCADCRPPAASRSASARSG
jgi:hypothetical protein